MRAGLGRRVLRSGGDFRLICVPFAGGSIQSFRPLAQAVTTDCTVLAVQPPAGRAWDLDGLADCYLNLLAEDLSGDGILFGHSLGAAVAHRMAALLGNTWPPSWSLVLSAPPVPRTSLRHLTLLSDEDFLSEATRLQLIDPPAVPTDALNRFVLPTLRQDLRVLPAQGWTPLPVPAPTHVIGGTQDPVARPATLRQIQNDVCARSLSMIDSGHLYPVNRPAETWAALAGIALDGDVALKRGD